MTTAPKFSVLMTTYNSAGTVRAGIDTLLGQSTSDFELVVVDDGSTDQTVDLINAIHDRRIRLIPLQQNGGPAAASNVGFAACGGLYVARADSDDLHVRTRLERQGRFLDENPSIAAVSCYLRPFSAMPPAKKGTSGPVWPCFAEPEELKAHLLFETSLPHPGLMLRRSSLSILGDQVYNPSFRASIDYELLTRMVNAGLRLAAVKAPLVRYREHPGSLGSSQRPVQVALANSLRLGWLRQLGLDPDNAVLELHNALATRHYDQNVSFLDSTEQWLLRLLAANGITRLFDADALRTVLGAKWYDVCQNLARNGVKVSGRYRRSPLPFKRSVELKARLRIKEIVLSRMRRAT